MISRVTLKDVACFKNVQLESINMVNLFCGKNNSGKSTLLKAICTVNGDNLGLYARSLVGHGEIEVTVKHSRLRSISGVEDPVIIKSLLDGESSFQIRLIRTKDGSALGYGSLGSQENGSFLYSSFSKRRIGPVGREIGLSRSRQSAASPDNISAKVDRILSDREFPNHENFRSYANKILGFPLSSIQLESGKVPGVTIDDQTSISIDKMGDGVVQILSLLVELFNSVDKIFVLEEPENDLHPSAISALCDLIQDSITRGNQFFISTHSNIVIRKFSASRGSSIFKITSSLDGRIPSSVIEEMASLDDKIRLLEEMGYDCYDLGLYSHWVVFEESTAERFFREYVFKWIFPNEHTRIRTISSNGKDKSAISFDAINAIFTVFNVGSVFKNKVVLALDSGESETKIVREISNKYANKGWSAENFINLSYHDFEELYPDALRNEFEKTKNLNREEKRKSKEAIFLKFMSYINDNEPEEKKRISGLIDRDIKKLVSLIPLS